MCGGGEDMLFLVHDGKGKIQEEEESPVRELAAGSEHYRLALRELGGQTWWFGPSSLPAGHSRKPALLVQCFGGEPSPAQPPVMAPLVCGPEPFLYQLSAQFTHLLLPKSSMDSPQVPSISISAGDSL